MNTRSCPVIGAARFAQSFAPATTSTGTAPFAVASARSHDRQAMPACLDAVTRTRRLFAKPFIRVWFGLCCL